MFRHLKLSIFSIILLIILKPTWMLANDLILECDHIDNKIYNYENPLGYKTNEIEKTIYVHLNLDKQEMKYCNEFEKCSDVNKIIVEEDKIYSPNWREWVTNPKNLEIQENEYFNSYFINRKSGKMRRIYKKELKTENQEFIFAGKIDFVCQKFNNKSKF